MTKRSFKNQDFAKDLGFKPLSELLPKYSSSVINNANGYANATRPENVTQVSETIKKFRADPTTSNSFKDWEQWYTKNNPDAIQKATDETWEKFQEILKSLSSVKRSDIEAWERDLIINKTYSGLMIQEKIISMIAGDMGFSWSLGSVEDEGKGIDGYINNVPVQIKATTYKSVRNERFNDRIVIIYYSKNNRTSDITFEYNPDDFK